MSIKQIGSLRGNEQQMNVSIRPAPPFQPTSQTSSPFITSGPMIDLESSGTPQIMTSIQSSRPNVVPEIASSRTSLLVRPDGPSGPPPQSNPLQHANAYKELQVQQSPVTYQPEAFLHGETTVGLASLHQNVHAVPSYASFSSRPLHPDPRPTSRPPLGGFHPGASVTMLPMRPQLHAPRPNPQQSCQQFQAWNVPPTPPTFQAHQGGLVQPPPPPFIGDSLDVLAEEFQSLSVCCAPGLTNDGIDSKSLPRPVDADEEPTSILQSYPLNCHPRFFRLTTHAMPNSQSLLSRWHLPLGAVVHPLAEVPNGEDLPVVNLGSAGIIRCDGCRVYINPYVRFINAGQKWCCNMCAQVNDVPVEYFCPLDENGRRYDKDQRPELSNGSVEFVATASYMSRPPVPPIYFFLIDVSESAVKCGMLEIVAKTIKECLDELPGFPRTKIGFLTFDSTLHFYTLKPSLILPQMMVVTDLEDVFVPLPDDLIANLADSRHVVDAFLDNLPSMFHDNLDVDSASGPALKAAHLVMRHLGGKLLLFQSTLPSLGVGCLRAHGNNPHSETWNHTIRAPQDSFYSQMAFNFVKHQISVDVYAFSDKFSGVGSIGTLAKYTGGEVYHYPHFQAAIHQAKLKYELVRDLTRETAWEACLRIRCGKGMHFTAYHGHHMLQYTDLLLLPAVDCDKAFAMQISLDESILVTKTVYFQASLVHTTSSGERRIRVHTIAVPVVSDLGEMYRQADTGAIMTLLSRLAIAKTSSGTLDDVRQFLQLKLLESLKEYRNLYVSRHRLTGRLIYPESLKFLPLYVLSLCKSVALRRGCTDVSVDESCASSYKMTVLPIRRLLKLLYPSLIRIDENLAKDVNDSEKISQKLALTKSSLDSRGLYILDDGFSFIIWFGRMLSSDLITSLLGVDNHTFPDLSKAALAARNNETSRKLMRLLTRLREKDPSYYQLCHMEGQDEQLEDSSLLLSSLIEDKTEKGMSYADWILHIYRG